MGIKEFIGKIGNIRTMDISIVIKELEKKVNMGLLAIILLCFGCGNRSAGENIEKEPQAMEEPPIQSEAEQSIPSVSTAKPDKKLEETTSIKHDSIDQLEIQGRTQEETELIHKILSEDKEEFEEFLTTDWEMKL